MDNRPIGIFDSGLGGLTAVKALREKLPDENIVYFGDSGRVPYGAKPVPLLRRMAVQDLDFLAEFDAKLIIAACGTVSSTAADVLERYPLPVFGVLKSSVETMSRIGGDAPLGVIATAACIHTGAFQTALAARFPEREIIATACPDFVTLIESGHCAASDELVQEAVSKYMGKMKAAGTAAVLLGCTHFGIIGEAISKYMGTDTRLISASECAALQARDYLVQNALTGGEGQERYYTSGSVEAFTEAASIFLGHDVNGLVQQVPVMEIRI